MTDLNIPELRKLALAATQFVSGDMMRYEHGGGRLAILRDGERRLVADLYHEGDTEYFAALEPAKFIELLRLAEIGQRAEAGEVNF